MVDEEHPGISIRADYLALSKTESVLFISGKDDTKLYFIDTDSVEDQIEALSSKEEVNICLFLFHNSKHFNIHP